MVQRKEALARQPREPDQMEPLVLPHHREAQRQLPRDPSGLFTFENDPVPAQVRCSSLGQAWHAVCVHQRMYRLLALNCSWLPPPTRLWQLPATLRRPSVGCQRAPSPCTAPYSLHSYTASAVLLRAPAAGGHSGLPA